MTISRILAWRIGVLFTALLAAFVLGLVFQRIIFPLLIAALIVFLGVGSTILGIFRKIDSG